MLISSSSLQTAYYDLPSRSFAEKSACRIFFKLFDGRIFFFVMVYVVSTVVTLIIIIELLRVYNIRSR